MDGKANANQIPRELGLEETSGQPHCTGLKNISDDLSSFDMGLYEATDTAQN